MFYDTLSMPDYIWCHGASGSEPDRPDSSTLSLCQWICSHQYQMPSPFQRQLPYVAMFGWLWGSPCAGHLQTNQFSEACPPAVRRSHHNLSWHCTCGEKPWPLMRWEWNIYIHRTCPDRYGHFFGPNITYPILIWTLKTFKNTEKREFGFSPRQGILLQIFGIIFNTGWSIGPCLIPAATIATCSRPTCERTTHTHQKPKWPLFI